MITVTLSSIFLQLFTRKAAQILYCNQRLQRWCFDVELLFLAQRLAVPVVETSVNWTEVPGKLETLPYMALHTTHVMQSLPRNFCLMLPL